MGEDRSLPDSAGFLLVEKNMTYCPPTLFRNPPPVEPFTSSSRHTFFTLNTPPPPPNRLLILPRLEPVCLASRAEWAWAAAGIRWSVGASDAPLGLVRGEWRLPPADAGGYRGSVPSGRCLNDGGVFLRSGACFPLPRSAGEGAPAGAGEGVVPHGAKRRKNQWSASVPPAKKTHEAGETPALHEGVTHANRTSDSRRRPRPSRARGDTNWFTPG
jgi:hypothetical protein